MVAAVMRLCRRCGDELPVEAFGVDRDDRDGLARWCKDCMNAYQRDRNRRRREAGIPNDPEREYRTRYAVLAHRARTRALPFTLTYEEFRGLAGRPCFYCGGAVPFLGVDRRDNDQGYTPENVVPACPLCNTWKSVLSLDEFAAHVARLYQRFVRGQEEAGQYAAPHLQRRWLGVGDRQGFTPRRRRRNAF